MPDGNQASRSIDAGKSALASTPRGRAEHLSARLLENVTVARKDLKELRSQPGNIGMVGKLIDHLAKMTVEFTEGATLFTQLAENPSAFRRSSRAGLSDVWELRKNWQNQAGDFVLIVSECRAEINKALAARQKQDEIPKSPPVENRWMEQVSASGWLEFLCRATEHFARRSRRLAGTRAHFQAREAERPRQQRALSSLTRARKEAIVWLAASPLFDAAFYLSQFDGHDLPYDDPALHFATQGWLEDKDPHPLFSTAFYLFNLNEPLPDDLDPLTHYATTGSPSQRNPHPLFDTAYLAARTMKGPLPGTTWLVHFLEGNADGQTPHPLFDPAFYAAQAGLASASAPLALMHYAVRGWRHGVPFSPFFDLEFYRSQWAEPPAGEPWTHYVMAGAQAGADPHPLFDGAHYRSRVPDAAIDNPLVHFLVDGEAKGVPPSPFFDPMFYRDTYRAGEPLAGSFAHFLAEGAKADHKPMAAFRSDEYRAIYMQEAPGADGASAIEHFLRSTLLDLQPAKIARLLEHATKNRPAVAAPVKPVPAKAAAPANGVPSAPVRDQAASPLAERPIPSVTKRPADDLKYRDYSGKVKYRPGAPHIMLVAHVAGEHLFGSERSFLDMVEALNNLPANLYVVLPRNVPDYTNIIRGMSQYVSIFSYPWWRDRNPESQDAVLLFKDLIQSLGIDAVHANTIMLRECLTAARLCNVPGVTHVRELINADRVLVDLIGESAETIIDEVRKRSDWIIGNSEITARVFDKPGASFFVPNTIDLERIDVPHLVNPNGKVRFGVVSSNIPKKGLADVVELAGLAAETCPNAEFLLIGPETDAVREIKAQQEAGKAPRNVFFPGYAATPTDAMRSLNVVLNLSHFAESFGRTVLEAMASSRPVICYEWGALPELVQHGVTGYLVPYRKPELALPYVRELCKRPDRIALLGGRGKEVAQARYGTKSYLARFQKVYRNILSVHAPLPKTRDGKLVRVARRPGLKQVETRPRIAYFCWHFPVPSETFVLNELEVLVRDGVDVLVFCRQSPHKNFKPHFPIIWERVDGVDTLARRLAETSRTMVHAHFTYPTVTDMVWPACEQAKIPFTFIAHAQDIFKYDNDRRNLISEVCASELCRKVFTLSRFHYDFLASRGVPRDKIVINPNAVSTDRFSAASDVRRDSRPFRRIIAIHRYVAKKGLSLLIGAAGLIRDMNVRIELFGYGDLEVEYRLQVEALGLTNVVVNGPLTQDQVVDEMRRADLFVCPSIRTPEGDMDGIPTSIVESMAAGVPVLATNIAGIPDLVVDGVTGIVCSADAESVAAGIRRFYGMPDAQVANMIAAAHARASRQHDSIRLVRVLRRVWENRVVDVVIVSWNNLAHLRAVVERVRANTALPYHLIVCDNQSRKEPVPQFLDVLWAEADNVTVIHNDRNAMVGPGTNAAMAEGNSDVVIYLCGKEGFSFANGWELPFVHAFAEDPEAGLVGTIGRSPTYLTGEQYPKGISLFPKFRNPEFATANKGRIFGHVQGGLFGIRRAMVEKIGGFSDDVPHDYTDVEYSYYVESCGWKLIEAEGVLALFNKSRPTLSQRFDENVVVAHPVDLDQIERFDAVRAGRLRHCNVCDWFGTEFADGNTCPSCGTAPRDRTLYRWLSEGPHMYRRLPALGVGLSGKLEKVWGEQFQGPRLGRALFLETLVAEGRLKNANGGLRLAVLRGQEWTEADLAMVVRELARVTSRDAPVLFQYEGAEEKPVSPDVLTAAMGKGGFVPAGRILYTSTAVRFAEHAVLAFERAPAAGL